MLCIVNFCKYFNSALSEFNASFSKDFEHKPFVFMTQLLREAIQVYGNSFNQSSNDDKQIFYGISSCHSGNLQFSSPLYVTIDRTKLLKFCQNLTDNDTDNDLMLYQLSPKNGGGNIKYLNVSQLFEENQNCLFDHIFMGDINPWITIDNT